MSKAKKSKETELSNAPETFTKNEDRNFEIVEAQIKDDFCHYSFRIIKGKTAGFTFKVIGAGIIEDDMRKAFAKQNVHLAIIDDVFKYSEIEIEDLGKMHGHELAVLFHVNGFKIKGEGDDESVILKGTKYVSAGGRLEIESPKISLDSFSSYKWYKALKYAVDVSREEVALYAEGKFTLPEKDDEPEVGLKQTKLKFAQPADAEVEDTDFANAAL
ncbi:MAG TPA: hypothetical protein VGM41_16590 [Chitinophagaceae bacterium]|jgi:hypothetical protein